ncbi:MAG: hypothetical protein M3042_08280 [Actinomycetota bacterium]|nr:hypothetical protein [Actinomycetota bacterium]
MSAGDPVSTGAALHAEPLRLRRPREHSVSRAGLVQLAGPAGRGGLVVGLDDDRAPVPVRLFRGEPTRLAVVGEPFIVRVLAFRALAVGARVRVVTPRPSIWRPLAGALGDDQQLVTFEPPGSSPSGGGSLVRPVLTVLDTGSQRADLRRAAAAWGTVLTLLPAVIESGAPVLRAAHLTILQRCGETEARRACAHLDLDPRHIPRLAHAPEDGLALVAGNEPLFLRLSATDIERRLLGDRL